MEILTVFEKAIFRLNRKVAQKCFEEMGSFRYPKSGSRIGGMTQLTNAKVPKRKAALVFQK